MNKKLNENQETYEWFMKMSKVKTSVKMSVGEGFYNFLSNVFFLFPYWPLLPQIGLQVVLDHLGEPKQATGYLPAG